MAVIFTETFTGSNGSGWGANWTSAVTGTGASATIQSNKGRHNAGTSSSGKKVDRYSGSNQTDVEFVGKLTFNSSSTAGAVEVWIRGDNAANNGNGYFLMLRVGSKPELRKGAGFTYPLIATLSSAPTIATATEYGVKLYAVGTTVKAKVWATSGGEPAYDYSGTDTSHTGAGQIWVMASNGGGTTGYNVDWDDVIPTDGASGTTADVARTQALAVTATATKAGVASAARAQAFSVAATAGLLHTGAVARPMSFAAAVSATTAPRQFTNREVWLWLNGAWVNVSQWVHPTPLVIHQGRPTEFDPVGPGTLSFTLENIDGRFMPDNPGSPYWPGIVEDIEVFVRLHMGASSWIRFWGTVKAWEPEFPTSSIHGGVVRVTAVDSLGIAANIASESCWVQGAKYRAGVYSTRWDSFILEGEGSAVDYFDNPTTSTGTKARATTVLATNNAGALSFGSADGLSVEGSAKFSPASTDVGAVIKVHTVNQMRCVQFWVKFPGTAQVSATKPQLDVLVIKDATNTTTFGSIRLTNNAGLQDLGWFNGAGTFITQLDFNCAEERWVRCTLVTNTAAPTTTDVTFDGGAGTKNVAMDLRNGVHFWFGGTGTLVPDMEVAGITLLGSELAAIPAADGLSNGAMGDIANRIASWSYISGSGVGANVGTATTQPVVSGNWHERKALEIGQEIAATGSGVLWSRSEEYSPRYFASDVCYPATPLVIIDCEGDLKGTPKLRRAVDSRPTRIVVSYPGGKSTVIDAAAEAASSGQARTANLSTIAPDYTLAETIGADLLTRSALGLRITSVTLDLETCVTTGLVAALFDSSTSSAGLRPTVRIRLLVPASHFGASFKDAFVQGWTETYDPKNGATITFDLTPA